MGWRSSDHRTGRHCAAGAAARDRWIPHIRCCVCDRSPVAHELGNAVSVRTRIGTRRAHRRWARKRGRTRTSRRVVRSTSHRRGGRASRLTRLGARDHKTLTWSTRSPLRLEAFSAYSANSVFRSFQFEAGCRERVLHARWAKTTKCPPGSRTPISCMP